MTAPKKKPADPQPMLAGLEPPTHPMTEIEKVARSAIDKLRAEGRLLDHHELAAQAVIDLARGVGEGARSGKSAGMAMAAKELREFMLLLPQTINDEFGALQEELRQANAAANGKKPAGK